MSGIGDPETRRFAQPRLRPSCDPPRELGMTGFLSRDRGHYPHDTAAACMPSLPKGNGGAVGLANAPSIALSVATSSSERTHNAVCCEAGLNVLPECYR